MLIILLLNYVGNAIVCLNKGWGNSRSHWWYHVCPHWNWFNGCEVFLLISTFFFGGFSSYSV